MCEFPSCYSSFGTENATIRNNLQSWKTLNFTVFSPLLPITLRWHVAGPVPRCFIIQTMAIQYIIKSWKVSKARDQGLDFSPGIFPIILKFGMRVDNSYPGTCQPVNYYITQSREFETLRDLTIRHVSGCCNGARKLLHSRKCSSSSHQPHNVILVLVKMS